MTAPGVVGSFRARVRSRQPSLLAVSGAVLAVSLLLPAGPTDVVPLAGPLALLGQAVLFVLLTGGWMGEELASGAAIFWVQTPHRPTSLLGLRFAGVASLAAVVAALLPAAVAVLLATVGQASVSLEILRRLPGATVPLAVLGVLIWGVGGWGVRGDTWAGPLAGLTLGFLELLARYLPDRLGVLSGPADTLGLPLDDLAGAASLLTGGGAEPASLLRVVPWMAAWVVLGAAGISRQTRRTGLADHAA